MAITFEEIGNGLRAMLGPLRAAFSSFRNLSQKRQRITGAVAIVLLIALFYFWRVFVRLALGFGAITALFTAIGYFVAWRRSSEPATKKRAGIIAIATLCSAPLLWSIRPDSTPPIAMLASIVPEKPNVRQQPEDQPDIIGDATAEYWDQLRTVISDQIAAMNSMEKETQKLESPGAFNEYFETKLNPLFLSFGNKIHALPVRNVDPQVIDLAAQCTTFMANRRLIHEEVAEMDRYVKQMSDRKLEIFVESFVRGLVFDFSSVDRVQGKVDAHSARVYRLAEKSRKQTANAVTLDANELRLRAALSTRYSRTFEPLFL
jgi:hypothetical protein